MGPSHFLRLFATKFFVLVVLLVLSITGSESVKVLEIEVPPQVRSGETVDLRCHYDLEGASLYSLNWWRGTEQFYQFSPNSPEQTTVYASRGITVDRQRSGQDVVVLMNVSRASAGRYKCEVLADHPSFEKDSEIANMEVIDVPTDSPSVVLRRHQWSPGETLEANCTSPGARPPPELHWYINGDKIQPQMSRLLTAEPRIQRGMRPRGYINAQDMVDVGIVGGVGGDIRDGLENDYDESLFQVVPRTSALKMKLQSGHFNVDGQASLTCVVTLPGLYHRSAEVPLTLPGFRAAAPSQKLYGGALRHGGTALTVLLSLTALKVLAL
ncbi:uncharacterized protein LOC125028352 [Penaeus chinensis]|uniref:uncharacterized protein LOC125028352 n=1 Tax=Penaeus chinensis TaxID=139456 RepID=UPI001FB5EE7B|nr:uncharacterized protein LOC125028352 [Penaeus chinensis]